MYFLYWIEKKFHKTKSVFGFEWIRLQMNGNTNMCTAHREELRGREMKRKYLPQHYAVASIVLGKLLLLTGKTIKCTIVYLDYVEVIRLFSFFFNRFSLTSKTSVSLCHKTWKNINLLLLVLNFYWANKTMDTKKIPQSKVQFWDSP